MEDNVILKGPVYLGSHRNICNFHLEKNPIMLPTDWTVRKIMGRASWDLTYISTTQISSPADGNRF